MAKNFDLSLLSEREQGILDLAIDGLTDQQIGHRLGITSSTVNSYWVRIRGKLGHLSRTELVSRIVQQRASAESNDQNTKIEGLQQEIKRLEGINENCDQANLMRAVIEAYPEACVVFDSEGKVILANARFESLFGLVARTTPGRRFEEFFSVSAGRLGPLDWSELPQRAKHGLKRPLFGVKADGRVFRALLVVGRADFEGEPIYSCVVRPFMEELEMRHERAALMLADIK